MVVEAAQHSLKVGFASRQGISEYKPHQDQKLVMVVMDKVSILASL